MQTTNTRSYTARHHIWGIHGSENSDCSLVSCVLQQPAASILRAEDGGS
jgi:hypothetical protein